MSRTRPLFLLALVLGGVLGLSACGGDTGGRAAITVNGESISINDFKAELELYADDSVAMEALAQQGLPEATGTDGATLPAELVANLATGRVTGLLMQAELADRDLEVTDEDVQAAKDELGAPQQDPSTGQEAPSIFTQLSEDLQQLIAEDKAASDVLDAALLEEDPIDLEPTEEEVAAALAATEGQTCASVILTETAEDATAALARVQGGEDFATVAAEVSLDQTAQQGGDIGCFAPGDLGVPALDEALVGLAEGAAAGPVPFESQGPDGSAQQAFIVVQSNGAPTEDDVRAQLAAAAEQEAAQRSLIGEFISEGLAEADVRIASRYGRWDTEVEQPDGTIGAAVVPPEGPEGETTTTSTTTPPGGITIDPATGQPVQEAPVPEGG